jgi:hypothetical protein
MEDEETPDAPDFVIIDEEPLPREKKVAKTKNLNAIYFDYFLMFSS